MSTFAMSALLVSVRATDSGGNSATITIYVTVNAPAHPGDDESYLILQRLVVSARTHTAG